MTREEAQKDFLNKSLNLIKGYEKNTDEEIELRFAFFDDDLNKYYYWEDEGFEYKEDFDVLVNERNHENEMTVNRNAIKKLLETIDDEPKPNSLFDKKVVHIHENMGDWVKLEKDEIGVKILDKEK